MTKFWLICAALLILAAPAASLVAQTNLTIPQQLAADPQGRFTILVKALDSTGLSDLLGGTNQYTLLAPTDTAFKTLLEFLGESQDALLADKDTLRKILLYHILPGRVFFRQFASGQPEATSLERRSVQGALVNGLLTIQGANVSDIDNVASNGVVQVIDRVLLPSDILPFAHVRFAQFSPDTPSVDIDINGAISTAQNLSFPSVSDWLQPPAAITTIAFTPAGKSIDQAVIVPSQFTLRPNSWTTLAAIGSLQQGSLILALIPESADPIPAGEAEITVLDALEDVPALDFSMSGATMISRLGFPFAFGDNDGFYSFEHRAGTYDLEAKNYGNNAPFSATMPRTEIDAGTHYLIAVVGTKDKPALFVKGDVR